MNEDLEDTGQRRRVSDRTPGPVVRAIAGLAVWIALAAAIVALMFGR